MAFIFKKAWIWQPKGFRVCWNIWHKDGWYEKKRKKMERIKRELNGFKRSGSSVDDTCAVFTVTSFWLRGLVGIRADKTAAWQLRLHTSTHTLRVQWGERKTSSRNHMSILNCLVTSRSWHWPSPPSLPPWHARFQGSLHRRRWGLSCHQLWLGTWTLHPIWLSLTLITAVFIFIPSHSHHLCFPATPQPTAPLPSFKWDTVAEQQRDCKSQSQRFRNETKV